MNGLPITATVSEVLALLQLLFHQGAAHAGVAVSVHPVGEPGARDADLSGVAALDHVVVSVAPFLHCQHLFPVSTYVLAEERCEAVGRLSVIRFVMLTVLKQAPAEVAILKRVVLTAGGSFQRDLFQSARKSSTCAPLLTVSL